MINFYLNYKFDKGNFPFIIIYLILFNFPNLIFPS